MAPAELPPGFNPYDTPSGIPPPGVIPNFVNPATRAPLVTVIVSVTLGLMLAFASFRAYADIRITKSFDKAGWACIIAAVAAIAYDAVLYYTLSQHILGKHIWDVPVALDTDAAVQMFTVLGILYGPVVFLAKLSVLFLYLRVFSVKPVTVIFTHIAMAVSLALCLFTVISYSVVCVPAPGHSWELADATHKCEVTADLLSVVMAAVSIFNDFMILVIPIPAVWSLQLALKKKIRVSAVFLVGLLVCLTSILNLYYRNKAYRSPQHDNTWDGSISYLLCAVEINVAIICSCMPSLAAYINRRGQVWSSLGSWISKRRQGSSERSGKSEKLHDDAHFASDDGGIEFQHLTLGSALRDGEFLKTGDRKQYVHS